MSFANDLQPWITTAVAVAILIAVMVIANWVSKRIIVHIVMRLLARMSLYGEAPMLGAVVTRLSNIVPALVIQLGIVLVPDIPAALVIIVQNVAAAFIILTIGLAIGAALNFANYVYERRPEARNRPIKGFLEVTKIVVYGVAVILIIAALIDRSPVLLFSGLGAMAAILILVFKDTLLS
ncbi:MAG: mechanosensitive ion channel family protein, partial [Alphaproteobacteria bacterium]|nr:mechanosensitive ion channel family protein [Alphaproteobacteria bacterium]